MDIFVIIISGVALTGCLIFLITQFFNIIFRGYAPFISTSKKVINKIFSGLEPDKNFAGKIYELGCGRAGFLKACARPYPKAKLIGIEYSLFPYVIAKIQQALGKNNIEIIKQNVFKTDLRPADIIYCYLNQKMMTRLEGKFKQECRPGTQIISYAFSLPNLKPKKSVKLTTGLNIYFYKI